jgi:hypothetical protein
VVELRRATEAVPADPIANRDPVFTPPTRLHTLERGKDSSRTKESDRRITRYSILNLSYYIDKEHPFFHT